MGIGLLKDAAVKERHRRLLAGADSTAALRCPRRAQIGALDDGERQAHRRLAATANGGDETRESETVTAGLDTNAATGNGGDENETRGPETVTVGRLHTNAAPRSSSAAEQEHATASSLLRHGKGPLCSNVLCVSRPQAELPSVALICGERLTHPHAAVNGSSGAPGESSAAGMFSKVDNQYSSDSDDNDRTMMPIFVSHGSGKLTLTVSIDQCTEHFMELYAQRTKTTLNSQYFVYERKRLEPNHTWLTYGLKRDTTVHVCTRLRGGADGTNLQDFIHNNKHNFIEVVPLLEGYFSLQMTLLGCQVLSSWIRCFATAFTAGKSWNGNFQLEDFKFVEGHVRCIKKPTKHSESSSSSVGDDLIKFADEVEQIFQFGHIPNLVSGHPPYLQSCMKMLRDLATPSRGQLPVLPGGVLSNKYKLLLDTLVCCMTSNARQSLIIELFRKYEGADKNEDSIWHSAIKGATCPNRQTIMNSAIFKYFIQSKTGTRTSYPKDKIGTFTLLRDVVMHAADWTENPDAPTLDATELATADILKDFLPDIIKNLIENNVDISAELLAAIRCACNICDSSH